jgi:hypothetical protein
VVLVFVLGAACRNECCGILSSWDIPPGSRGSAGELLRRDGRYAGARAEGARVPGILRIIGQDGRRLEQACSANEPWRFCLAGPLLGNQR